MSQARTGSPEPKNSDSTSTELGGLDFTTASSGSPNSMPPTGTLDETTVPTIPGSTETETGNGPHVPLGFQTAAPVRPSPVLTVLSSLGGSDDDGDVPDAASGMRPGSAVLEDDSRSLRGSIVESEATEGAAYNMAQSGMPRNFRVAVEGYILLQDQDGTYAAYRINVTAGLHQWHVLRR